ncbi:MAG: hypothetical protein LBN24_08740 [Mediterranea sp.]|jgi:hypothetical protein|nr:hypothetical protein [Mediterranea sp.]
MKRITKTWLLALCLLTAYSCQDDEPLPLPNKFDFHIVNMPPTLTFDRVRMDITGANWAVIATYETPCDGKDLHLALPTTFTSSLLQQVDRGADQKDYAGYWPATASDPNARVATIGDIYLYNGDQRVARLRLSNWTGSGSSASKANVYLQFADRPFSLSGQNKSYRYENCSFQAGWNAFANINPVDQDNGDSGGTILCTTQIPTDVACYVTEVR